MKIRLPGALMLMLVLLTGCSQMVLQETKTVANQVREDQIKFYEYLANSYYLLGYEYYVLAKELEAQNEVERSQNMAQLSLNYSELHEDLSASADLLRERYNLPRSGTPRIQVLADEAATDATLPTPSDTPEASPSD